MECSIVGCGKPVKARGWCVKHYHRWWRHGDPFTTIKKPGRPPQPPQKRFWSKVDRQDAGCWPWTGSTDIHGYGVFKVQGKLVRAHRFAYELLVGPIPDDLTLDHLCRNRACVNPADLEPVTRGENVLRGETIPAKNAAKTHCPRGHLYDAPNTYVDPAHKRVCRTCHRDKERARRGLVVLQ